MSYPKFGSRKHIQNCIDTIEIAIRENISMRYGGSKWNIAQRTTGMMEALLCIYKPDKFAPGNKFEYKTFITTKKKFFGGIKQVSRKESYPEMLVRNLKEVLSENLNLKD